MEESVMTHEEYLAEEERKDREHLRAMLTAHALTGLLAADHGRALGYDQAAHEAVRHADAALADLDKAKVQ